MKIFKRATIVIGFVIAGVVFGALGFQLYLNTDQAKEKIQAKMNQEIPGTLTWRSDRFSILRGEAQLKHVRLTGPDNKEVMALDRLLIHISWMGFLKGELNIHDLLLENLHLYLVRDRSGNFNLIQAFYTTGHKPPESDNNGSFPFNILLRRLHVTNGFVEYNTSEKNAGNRIDRLELRNMDLTVTDGNLLTHSGRIFCRIGEGHIQIKGAGTDIDHLSIKANVWKNSVSGLFFDMTTDGLYARITGTVENLFTNKPVLDLHLNSRASLYKISHLTGLGPDFSGEIQADSNLKGAIENPDISLQLGYKGGKLSGWQIQRIHLECRLKNKRLNIIDANADTPWGRFHIKGDVDFTKALPDDVLTSPFIADAVSYKLFIQQKASQLKNLAPSIRGLKGVVHADMKLEGNGIDPKSLRAETVLELYGEKLSTATLRSPIDVHVKARADVEKGRVTVRSLAADTHGMRFEMTGSYDIFSRQTSARFGLNVSDLTEMLSKLDINGVRGMVNIAGKMSGTLTEPFMDARLKGERLGFKDVRFDSADANFGFSKGQLSMKRGEITSGDSKVDLSGDIQIFDPVSLRLLRHPIFTAALAGSGLSLKDFIQGMGGKLDLNGRIEGDISRPRGKLEVYGKDVDLGIQKIHSVRLTSRIDGRRFEVDPLMLAIVPGEQILLNGWISLNKHYELRMASTDISIKNIQKLRFLKANGGKISFALEGKGEFANPQLKGKAIVEGLTINDKKIGKIPFNIGVENRTAYIDGGLNFDFKATYGLQTRFFSTFLRFDHTVLTPYLQLFGKKDLSGNITGYIDIKGEFREPIKIDGGITIDQLALFWKKKAVVTGRDLKVFVNKNEISVPKMRLSLLEHGYFMISGSGKLWKSIGLKAEGVIPFSVLPVFTDSISDAGGKARITLRVSENGLQPAFDFEADFENGSIDVPGLFQRLHNVNGHLRATPTAVTLDNIQGMLGDGRFKLSGTVDLDRYRWSDIALKLKADNLPITIPDVLDVRLSSELDVRGSPKRSLIKGDITILEGRYTKDVRLNPIGGIARESQAGPRSTSTTSWPSFDNMGLDCRIRYKEPFVVDNNIALLTIKPDLHVQGTVNHPLITGRAEVESGTVYFRKNDFNVKKGVLDFINPYKIEPTVDIQADAKVREWTVTLNVSGTLDNLKFNLSSNPSESEQDILSLLITGKTTQELIAGQGGSLLSPKQMLADVLAENAQKEIKNATGLDIVTLGYNGTSNGGTPGGVNVTLGKELSKRVTVKYGAQTKNAKVIQKVVAEYKFLETLLMNTFEDNEGNYGAGIQFRLEFR